MGSTIISVLIQNETLYYTNLGDSRIYLLRNGKLKQITKDHTEGQRMVDEGILTPEQLKTHHSRNKINRHLGIFPEEMRIECEEYEDITLKRGDKLLLCSDGVFGVLEDQTMISILSEKKSVKARAEKLVDVAFSSGSKDNMTAVVIDYDNSASAIIPILVVAAASVTILSTVLAVCLVQSPKHPETSESSMDFSEQSILSEPEADSSSTSEQPDSSDIESIIEDESSNDIDVSEGQDISDETPSSDSEPVAVESIIIDYDKLTMKIGESIKLQLTVKPDNATDKSVSWQSSNLEIVDVDDDGNITAKKEGSATITVMTSDKRMKATCKIQVQLDMIPLDKIEIQKELALEIGGKESEKLTVTFIPANATDKNLEWKSDDSSVATVDQDGFVTAKNVGETVITVKTKGEATATCKVTVSHAFVKVTGIKLNTGDFELQIGGSKELSFIISPKKATNQSVTWESDNESVAEVDDKGNVIAIGEGTAKITVETVDGSFRDTCEVKVSKKDDPSSGETSIDDRSTDVNSGDNSKSEHSDGLDSEGDSNSGGG